MSEEHQNYPNGLEATLLVVVLLAIEIAVAGVLLSFDTFADVNHLDLAGLIAVIANGVLFCALLAYKRMGYGELFHASRHSVVSTLALLTAPIVLLVPGLVIVAGALNSIVVALFPMTPAEQEWFGMMSGYGPLAIFFGCIAAPVLEEMLFRGIILRSFLLQYSRTTAILASAALFGIAHLNVYQLVTAFAVGIVAGWLYERTRSLWPCIVLHAAYNGFVTYSYMLFDSSKAAQDFTAGFYFGAFALAIAAGFWLLKILMPGKALRSEKRSTSAD